MSTVAQAPHAAAILKRQYRNNTGGWLGVVIISPKGDELGTNIEPYGTIWLSDEEAILTSRAPRRAEDNPFELQTFVMVDEAGVRQDAQMRPLELCGDGERYVPANDRYVPGDINAAHAQALAEAGSHGAEPANYTTELNAVAAKAATVVGANAQSAPRLTEPVREPPAVPPSTGSADAGGPPAPAPDAPPLAPVPPMRSEPAQRVATAPGALVGTAGAASEGGQAEEEARQSWVEPPVAPGQVLRGSLGGDNSGTAVEPQAPLPREDISARPTQIPQAPVVQAPPQGGVIPRHAGEIDGRFEGGEEHAAEVDRRIGEEAGAAAPPAGSPAEGEYAQAEEVGSPGAPGLLGDED